MNIRRGIGIRDFRGDFLIVGEEIFFKLERPWGRSWNMVDGRLHHPPINLLLHILK